MPADTYSSGLGYLVMGVGNDNNSWGTNANNSVFQIFEDALVGVLTQAVTGGTLDLSGTAPPAGPSQVRHWQIKFTGVLSSNQIVVVPNIAKGWVINNQTTGAFTLTFKTSAGSASAAIPQGTYTNVWCDGNNGINVSPYSGTGIDLVDGSAAAPAYSYLNENKSGWYRWGTQDLRLSINSVDILQVTGAGAATPSVMNLLSGVLQIAGAQVVPPGTEIAGAFIELPAGGWYFEDGTAYSRATDANLFNAITKACTGNTHTSTTVDNLSVDLRGKGLEGAFIEGTGIPTGTTIVSINSATSMTISAAAVSTLNGISLRILPWGQGDASTTFNVPDRRDRSLFGRGNMNGTAANRMTVNASTHLSTTGGEEQHTLVTAELPVITPTGLIGGSQTLTNVAVIVGNDSATGGTSPRGSPTNPVISGSNFTFTGNSFGGGTSHNNMPLFGITNFAIKR